MSVNEIFDLIATARKRVKSADDVDFELRLSVLAVFDEHHVYDMLADKETVVGVAETPELGFHLPNARSKIISTPKDLLEVLERVC